MKIKVSEASGPVLDWMVAEAEGNVRLQYDSREGLVINNILGWIGYRPSIAWQQGGPIIEREKITVEYTGDPDAWCACIMADQEVYGPTPLIAAMRCLVASKLGDVVDVPDELTR